MKHSVKILMAAAAAAALAGCSFNPIGESKFDCNRRENPSEYCRSFKALEKSTNGPLPESRFDKEFKMSDYDRATGVAPDRTAPEPGSVPAMTGQVLPHQMLAAAVSLDGMPVRKAPVVQRVFIKRFVDENDSLQGDMIVYREVKGARWTGFEGVDRVGQFGGAYPHRAKDSIPATAENEIPQAQQTNLAQPEGTANGMGGSAMSPAGSGGFSSPKTER